MRLLLEMLALNYSLLGPDKSSNLPAAKLNQQECRLKISVGVCKLLLLGKLICTLQILLPSCFGYQCQ